MPKSFCTQHELKLYFKPIMENENSKEKFSEITNHQKKTDRNAGFGICLRSSTDEQNWKIAVHE